MPTNNLAYRDAFGTGMRPYLDVEVIGPNGKAHRLVGIVDSGADQSCLPWGYAALMGDTGGNL